VQGYREKAGMSQPIHPHLFRHQMLTYLTTKGLSDAQIQLISGHESKKEPGGLPTPVTRIGR
jgi:integrase/recombinase XerD